MGCIADEWDAVEEAECLRLANIPGVGNLSIFRLLEKGKNARGVMKLSEKDVMETLDTKSAKAFLRAREDIPTISPAEFTEKYKMNFIPWTSPQYPERLRHIPDPPFALYVKGELPCEEVPTVAIIGARACSEYGKAVAAQFGRQLGAVGVQIISGMARGIDGIAQKAALDINGKSYAVLGCGADVCYPPESNVLYEQLCLKGGVISEYPPGTEAKSGFFPMRNRIISGLADLLLVVEARKRSGTYITVTRALEQGKDVYVVPGRITDALSEGCNFLLSQGAGVACSPEILLQALAERGGYDFVKKQESYSGDSAKDNVICRQEKDECSRNNDEKYENKLIRMILHHLELTPLELQQVYEAVNREQEVSYGDFMLEITKMQIAGLIEGDGNYFRLRCAL